MKIVYDTEFLEDGNTIELISIGLVAEDGREMYRINSEAPWKRIRHSSWLMDNVVCHLPQLKIETSSNESFQIWMLDMLEESVRPKAEIAADVEQFILGGWTYPLPDLPMDPMTVGNPQLWADYSAYDHVALCQLWGPMMDLPTGIPKRTNDIVQYAESLGIAESEFPLQTEPIHHALEDAKHNMRVLRYLAKRDMDGEVRRPYPPKFLLGS